MFTKGVFRAFNTPEDIVCPQETCPRRDKHKSPGSAEWPLDEWRAHLLPNEKLQKIFLCEARLAVLS